MSNEGKKLIEKSIKLKWGDRCPLFKGIYIVQEKKLHDSGYRLMNIIGHTEYDKDLKDFKYYLISGCSDVVDFTPLFSNYLIGINEMGDLHLDINKNGLIHIWTNGEKRLKCDCLHLSSCGFEFVNNEKEG